ncbi:MAG: hypothetical protein IH843_01195 [Thaumarchaeota archaeon]|nr:hypothetical protein [Nitrososphaerota archaeon]
MTASGEPSEGVIKYFVKDIDGKILVEISENIIIDDVSYVKEIKMPESLTSDNYLIYVVLTHGGRSAVASTLFLEYTLPSPAPIISPLNSVIMLLIILAIAAIIFIKIHKNSHHPFSVMRESK